MSDHEKAANQVKNTYRIRATSDGTAAYLYLPNHPKEEGRVVGKTIQLIDLLGQYSGPEILLDFGLEGDLIGIEILIDTEEDSEHEDEEELEMELTEVWAP